MEMWILYFVLCIRVFRHGSCHCKIFNTERKSSIGILGVLYLQEPETYTHTHGEGERERKVNKRACDEHTDILPIPCFYGTAIFNTYVVRSRLCAFWLKSHVIKAK